jgi:hypothetical protein
VSWLVGLAAKVFGEALTERLRRFLRDYIWGWRFGILSWIVVVAVVALSRDGAEAAGKLRWWLIGASGVAAILIAAAIRRALPLRPRVLVARFQPIGAANADEAETIRQRVYEALDARAHASGIEVDTLDELIDPRNAVARRRALGLARGRRSPVVVTATVAFDEELRFTPWILQPPQIRRPIGAKDDRVTRAVPAKSTSVEIAAYKNAEAANTAQLAQLALGMALVGSRHRRRGQRILEAVEPPTYESLFMASFAAFLDERYSEAAELSLRAIAIEPRSRAVGVAIWSLVEIGEMDEAKKLAQSASKLTAEVPVDTEDAAGYLLQMGITRLAASVLEETTAKLGQSLNSIAAGATELINHLESSGTRLLALRAYHDGDDAHVRALLEPLVNREAADAGDLALYAAADARAGNPAAQGWADRAAAALPPSPDEESRLAWSHAAEAYAYLGDNDRALSLLTPLADNTATPVEWIVISMDRAFKALRETEEFEELERRTNARHGRQERAT